METISITDSVYERIALLGRAWDTTEGEVVRRLLEEFTKSSRRSKESDRPDGQQDQVAIHCVYEGKRTEGSYHPDTKRVDITTGVLAGKSFRSPSGAAIAVVHAIKPAVHPNRNGWYFWVVTETGELLKSIR